jgi:Fe-S-cluster-containing dehydrogenase component
MGDYIAVIDVTKCVDCRCCVISCKDEYSINDYPPYSGAMPLEGQKWVHVENIERGTYPKVKFSSYPVMCMHCDNAPCISAATGGAVYKRPDGIVIIDPVKAKGQKQIVDSCPYGVIYWNADSQIPQKCTFCAHRLDQGKVPRCMLACPGKAITIGDRAALMENLQWYGPPAPYHPEYKTQNRVVYIGLPKTFITGSVVDSKGECLAGATVTCTDTATKRAVLVVTSDFLGDFWLDGLIANGSYDITVTAAGKTKTVSVSSLSASTNLGDIQLA